MAAEDHWRTWHRAYEDPSSSQSRRLAVIQRRLREALDRAPDGPLSLISMCAGQGRDVLGVLAEHPRRGDVRARLVELDPELADDARKAAAGLGLDGVAVVEGDAGGSSIYAGAAPADVLLACGIFGNVSADDICTTVAELPHLLAEGATVIWTRHRMAPDLTPSIRGWFTESGFEEVAFDGADDVAFGVGTARFVGEPLPHRPGRVLFEFVGDGSEAAQEVDPRPPLS